LSINAEDSERTALFARYSLVGALLAAFGAWLAAAPDLLVAHLHITMQSALQAMFALYGVIGLISALIYATLPEEREVTHKSPAPLKTAKSAVFKLAALFCIDSFGGGFVVQSMIALWMFQKFHLSIITAGTIFFWMGLFASFSYLVAVRIAKKIGLVNTMVFTHFNWVIILLLIRGALSQMDVPTRGSFVMAIVPPEERAAAAAMTAVPRSLAAAIGPSVAGYLLSMTTFGFPLLVAGCFKILYDLLLLGMFRSVRPPEESATT
jgi:MFS family permease